MSFSDPSGLLGRVPELEAFASHPKIRAALAAGKPRDVWSALRKAHRKGELNDPDRVAESILAHRRWFMEPASPPTMFTLNGIGTTLYGETEREQDGSYIATLFLAFVFVPVFPLAQYLVQRAPTRGWYFFGKVPNGPFVSIWRASMFAGVAALIALGVFGAWRGGRYVDVVVANALPFPVEIAVGNKHATVQPREHAILSDVPAGQRDVVAKGPEGRVVDRGRLDVRAGADALIWNVAGAGRVYTDRIVYTSESATPPSPTTRRTDVGHCGEHAIRVENADYVFTQPPSNIEMASGAHTETRALVAMEPVTADQCLTELMEHQPTATSVRYARDVLEAMDFAPDLAMDLTTRIAESGATNEAIALAERAVAVHDDVEMHRVLQEAYEGAGRMEEMKTRYRARAEAAPESGDAAYLSARLETPEATLAIAPGLVTRFPEHVRIRNLAASAYVTACQYADAIREFEALETLDPAAWAANAGLVVEAYRGASRLADFVPRLLAAFDREPNIVLASVYAIVSPENAEPPPKALFDRVLADVNDPGKEAFIALRMIDADRLEVPVVAGVGADIVAGVREIREAFRDPHADVVALASRASPDVIAALGERLTVALAAETLRTAPTDPLVDRLVEANPGTLLPAFVEAARSGVGTRRTENFPPSYRCLLEVTWAARPGTTREERARLLDLVRRDDQDVGVFHAVAARAIGG